MKKLLTIALIGLYSFPSHGTNRAYVNGKYYSCDGYLYVRNGEAWCNGQRMDANTEDASWFSWIFGNSNAIQGSGKAKTKQIPIKQIKKKSASGAGNPFIEQCKDPQNCIEILSVTADDNILPYLKQDTSDDKLTLRSEGNFNTKTPIRYHATIKDIDYISNFGPIDIQSSPISTDELTIISNGLGNTKIKDLIAKQLVINKSNCGNIEADINTDDISLNQTGSGDITIRGNTNTQTIHKSGSGNYKSSRLKSKNTSIHSDGSGDIYLNVEEKITGYSSGSGDIFYNSRYNPYVNITKEGIGEIKRSSW